MAEVEIKKARRVRVEYSGGKKGTKRRIGFALRMLSNKKLKI